MNTWAVKTRNLNTRNKGYRLRLGGACPKPHGSPPTHRIHANDQPGRDEFAGRRSFAFLLVFFAAAAGISGSAFIWSML